MKMMRRGCGTIWYGVTVLRLIQSALNQAGRDGGRGDGMGKLVHYGVEANKIEGKMWLLPLVNGLQPIISITARNGRMRPYGVITGG